MIPKRWKLLAFSWRFRQFLGNPKRKTFPGGEYYAVLRSQGGGREGSSGAPADGDTLGSSNELRPLIIWHLTEIPLLPPGIHSSQYDPCYRLVNSAQCVYLSKFSFTQDDRSLWVRFPKFNNKIFIMFCSKSKIHFIYFRRHRQSSISSVAVLGCRRISDSQ